MTHGKILVVDDEAGMREIIRDDLLAEGFEVLTANSGRQALEILVKNHVILIISDVRMPDGDGIFLATEVRKIYPEIPFVVLITGFSDITQEEANSLMVKDILPKPYQIDRLLSVAHKWSRAAEAKS